VEKIDVTDLQHPYASLEFLDTTHAGNTVGSPFILYACHQSDFVGRARCEVIRDKKLTLENSPAQVRFPTQERTLPGLKW